MVMTTSENVTEKLSVTITKEKDEYLVSVPSTGPDTSPSALRFSFLARAIPGTRWHEKRQVRSVPVREREALWSALRSAFGGRLLRGPDGRVVRVPAPEAVVPVSEQHAGVAPAPAASAPVLASEPAASAPVLASEPVSASSAPVLASAPVSSSASVPTGWPATQRVPLRKPRSRMQMVEDHAIEWTPLTVPQFLEGGIRSGDSFAVVRSEYGRWPLGHAQGERRDHTSRYTAGSHTATFGLITDEAGAGSYVEPGQAYQDAHGYRVARDFVLSNLLSARLESRRGEVQIRCVLSVVHDHTAKGSVSLALVVQVKDGAGAWLGVGSVDTRRYQHRGSQVTVRLPADALAMASETAPLAQTALVDLLRKASATPATPAILRYLERDLGIVTTNNPYTLLECLQGWAKGTRSNMSYKTWSRCLDDEGIRAIVSVLGPSTAGAELDAALGVELSRGRYAAVRPGAEAIARHEAEIAIEEAENAKKAGKRTTR